MANLGTEFAMLLLVSGNWHALASSNRAENVRRTSNLSIHLKRPSRVRARTDMLPYSIDVVCLIRAIVSGLSGFFATRGMTSPKSRPQLPGRAYRRPHVRVQMIVNVPAASTWRTCGKNSWNLRFAQPRRHPRTVKS